MSRFGDGEVGQDPATSSTAVATPSDAPSPHAHYAVNIGDAIAIETPSGFRQGSGERGRASERNRTSRSGGMSPVIRRRGGQLRAATFMTVEDFEDFQARPGWHPGDEPGLDPSKPDGGHASMPILSAPCQITIVDFSPDRFAIRKLDNATLEAFVKQPQPAWVKCRWINVNGLSWDVIQVLGRHKNLHSLAIEDIMNIRNRTKAEWYPTHAFMILTLQKLVHICELDSDDSSSDSDSDSDSDDESDGRRQPWKGFARRVQRLFSRKKQTDAGVEPGQHRCPRGFEKDHRSHATGFPDIPGPNEIRTLQQYQGVPNDPRTLFMEKHSPLSSKELAVTCEQVSMFINQDNSIISFFELSAHDVEGPIIRRLQTSDTILRQSCDASMVGQAIIDAIIDLAIPATACYSDVIRDLELDVLTRPTLDHTKSLYIVITEINKMLSLIAPIVNLINTLRDHKTPLSQDAALRHVQDPNHAVLITPMTYTYLGDVLDHCVLISDSLNQLKSSADGMIGLIFNTITTYQNESMKQLTVATIIFLPLTFLTGYFGQNFAHFPDIDGSINYFWLIAAPVEAAIILVLLKDIIYQSFKSLVQRRYVLRLRRRRRRSMRRRKKMKRT